MKKILSVLALFCALNAFAGTVTVSVAPYSTTNIVVGGCIVKQFVVSGTANSIIYVYDAPTWTNFTYTIPAYSNTVSYATNYAISWTNYWGAVTTTTNLSLVDQTNSVVPASTNWYPLRITVIGTANSPVILNSVNYQFANGVQVSNSTSTATSVTATYSN